VLFNQEGLGFSSASETLLPKRTRKRGWVKVKFTLEQAMKAERASRGIGVLFC
jgi:hypothetical protein